MRAPTTALLALATDVAGRSIQQGDVRVTLALDRGGGPAVMGGPSYVLMVSTEEADPHHQYTRQPRAARQTTACRAGDGGAELPSGHLQWSSRGVHPEIRSVPHAGSLRRITPNTSTTRGGTGWSRSAPDPFGGLPGGKTISPFSFNRPRPKSMYEG